MEMGRVRVRGRAGARRPWSCERRHRVDVSKIRLVDGEGKRGSLPRDEEVVAMVVVLTESIASEIRA